MASPEKKGDRLILFDIDNTLLNGSECHKLAFYEGLKIAYGVETSIDIIDNLGMTDKEIIYEVLRIHGFAERDVTLKLQECFNVLADVFNRFASNYQIKVLDGVKELLDKLRSSHVLIGLVTGNLESIAWKKLQMAGLDCYFSLGGFGSDDAKKSNLIRLAIRKAVDKFDFTFDNNVYVFGDTVRDVRAGKEAHVKTVGVATGTFTKDQLIKSGADFVFADLKDTSNILKMILN
jgi:phosphoglycolate phosphatase